MVLAKLVDLVVDLSLHKNLIIGRVSIPLEANGLCSFLALQLAVVQIKGRVVEIHG